ncbi:flagellar assembly peptidoglycan hydrolase FlgJ [Catenovulum sp. 2E275]|uniref:flagellar assembly peptidoglycan hydrolase FlgJ n=1 Tax=Catenovulum sp. 2E275 TaxID=2980497 RepID=UPI0021D0FFBB|nr:flagellar assembly peptidoglycan hydrolase FlgJ [Catenovulum sp. 2E275]MCU4676429.1 flagellar assembly peptidoglycan hydrolase FlgJ [Catenovulum sp. 2E275]
MDKIEQTQLYTDFAGLDELRKGGLNNDKAALKKAAQHFESIFMKMMLKSMRQAEEVLADQDSPFNSQTAKFYRDMHDDQLAVNLSQTGALGLADLIVEQLDPNSQTYKNADVLRNNASLQQALNNPMQSFNLNQKPERDEITDLADLMNVEQANRFRAANAKYQANYELDALAAINQPQTDISFNSKQDFVDTLMPVAQKVADKLGLSPVAMIAQAALETGWGQKMIQNADGSNALNFFGIKADSRWAGDKTNVTSLEYRNGVAVREKSNFRSYQDIEQALQDYTQFINDNPRYNQALSVAHDPNAYVTELQNAGYATDPNYAQKIQTILKDSVFEPYINMLKF